MSDFDAMHGQEGPASEEGAGRSLGRDAAGLGLFALATLLGVSVFMSISSPAVEPRGTTALFTGLSRLFGPWPLFAFALTLAFLGGRLWVAGQAKGLVRFVAGAAAVTLALSILASAAVAGTGGTFGDWIGGGLSSVLTPFAGVPLALLLLVGVVWAVWFRTPGTQTPSPYVEKAAPRRAAQADSDGLTPDEAAALLPLRARAPHEQESQDGDGPASPEAANVTGRSIQVAPDLRPLYPPDVRLQGGIPEGTRPLETRDQAQPLRARQPGRSAEPERAAPERPRAESSGGPIAPATLQRSPEPHAAPPQRPAVADLAAAGAERDAAGEHLILPAGVSPLGEPRAARGVVPLASSAAPLPPSWESEDEDDAFEIDDEVAEPISVSVAAASEVDEAAEVDEIDELEAQDELDGLASELGSEVVAVEAGSAQLPRPGWEQPGLFDEEPVDAYGTPTKLVDALRKSNQATAGRLQSELDDAELDDAEPEEDVELETAAAELDETEADGDDESEDEEADGDELEDSEDRVYAEEESDEEDDDADEDLEGDGEIEGEDGEAVASDEGEETPEPEVILEPRRRSRPAKPTPAANAAKPRAQRTEVLDPESDLLFRAGALFIERGRVAVSMLQRDFSLDFKQATSLLDQLQDAGLIGPYLGGQRRDILLSMEEWRERRIGTA